MQLRKGSYSEEQQHFPQERKSPKSNCLYLERNTTPWSLFNYFILFLPIQNFSEKSNCYCTVCWLLILRHNVPGTCPSTHAELLYVLNKANYAVLENGEAVLQNQFESDE